MPISPNFSSVFEETHKVTFLNCQSNGYLKLTDLCNFFQLTAGTHAELGGISYADMQEHHQAWVLSRMRVEITQLPKWQDEVMVKTWIKSLENSRSIRCLEMYLNDEKIAGCETFWVVINTKTRRPENLASPHEHFEKYMIDATSRGTTKVNLVLNTEIVAEKVVKLSDIDIINHVNNVKYLEWCLDTLEPEIILNQTITSFDINFLQEINLLDVVQIHSGKKEKNIDFSITKNDKICYALELHLKN